MLLKFQSLNRNLKLIPVFDLAFEYARDCDTRKKA